MSIISRKKNKKAFILKVAMVAFAIYSIGYITLMQIDISSRKDALNQSKSELKEQQIINKEVSDILNSDKKDEYIMRIAREKLGFVFPDERVFIDISGNNMNN
ncbi:MAG: septum formation initiator family protein [Oscillospiraceae bacterium]